VQSASRCSCQHSLDSGLRGSYYTKGSLWLIWSHHFQSCIVVIKTRLTVIYTGDDHGYIPYFVVTILSFFSLSWLIIWFLTRSNTTSATNGIAHSSEHLDSPLLSLWNLCRLIFYFLCSFWRIIVWPFVLFLLVIVLAVLLRVTASECPFGIIKLFYMKLDKCDIYA